MKKYVLFSCTLALMLFAVPALVSADEPEMDQGRIINLENPINPQDAATKDYVDNVIAMQPVPPAVLNGPGQSETAAMSQKAVVEAINDIIVNGMGSSQTEVMSQESVTTAIEDVISLCTPVISNIATRKGQVKIGKLLIQWGNLTVSISAANTPSTASITFPLPYASPPIVICNSNTTVPGTQVTGISAQGNTNTGFTAYVTRTNTTGIYYDWLAIGQSAT